jgi:hypothetical protein
LPEVNIDSNEEHEEEVVAASQVDRMESVSASQVDEEESVSASQVDEEHEEEVVAAGQVDEREVPEQSESHRKTPGSEKSPGEFSPAPKPKKKVKQSILKIFFLLFLIDISNI